MAIRSRRQFLEESMLSAVAATAGAHLSNSLRADELPAQPKSPNEKLGIAVVGVRHRGGAHIAAFTARKDAEILWVADVDQAIGNSKVEEVEKLQGRRPRFTQDMREALNDPSVDIVSIATPNHWHALASIWAMQHGKDVYVEKPVSHNVSEGRRIVEAARKYNRICQTGTQARSMAGVREAMQFLHEGKLGKLTVARGLCYKLRPSIGSRGYYPVSKSVDYDLWLGPAPEAPVTRAEFHYDWHWQWPYGNGDLGNQGVHEMDMARWGLGLPELSKTVLSYGGRLGYEDAGDTPNTQVVIHGYGDKTLIFEVRGLPTAGYRGTSIGVIFEGSEGYMAISAYAAGVFDREGKLVQKFSGGSQDAHYDNFISSVRSRKPTELNADILEGHISSALCHVGNASYRLGDEIGVEEARRRLSSLRSSDDASETFDRTCRYLIDNHIDLTRVKLRFGPALSFDPIHERFVGNPAAEPFLTREYRAPYIVPEQGQV